MRSQLRHGSAHQPGGGSAAALAGRVFEEIEDPRLQAPIGGGVEEIRDFGCGGAVGQERGAEHGLGGPAEVVDARDIGDLQQEQRPADGQLRGKCRLQAVADAGVLDEVGVAAQPLGDPPDGAGVERGVLGDLAGQPGKIGGQQQCGDVGWLEGVGLPA